MDLQEFKEVRDTDGFRLAEMVYRTYENLTGDDVLARKTEALRIVLALAEQALDNARKLHEPTTQTTTAAGGAVFDDSTEDSITYAEAMAAQCPPAAIDNPIMQMDDDYSPDEQPEDDVFCSNCGRHIGTGKASNDELCYACNYERAPWL